jgi:hypothetical protein
VAVVLLNTIIREDLLLPLHQLELTILGLLLLDFLLLTILGDRGDAIGLISLLDDDKDTARVT